MSALKDRWASAAAYEAYMGRWSRRLAENFVAWLAPEPGRRWLDVGCGTGALTRAILRAAEPAHITGCDPAEAFVAHARESVESPLADFQVAGIDRLPQADPGYDWIVAGLVFNFLPDPDQALLKMKARLAEGGGIAVYVWDYSDGMEFLRIFWEEAAAADPEAADLDEGSRFPICREGALAQALSRAGLSQVQEGAITIPTVFSNFSDFWAPFELGTGSGPTYVAGLDPQGREALKARLQRRLLPSGDGPISLAARAWAASGLLDPAGESDR